MPKEEPTREELFPSLSKEIEEKTKNKEDSISDRHKYIDIIKNKEKTEPTEKGTSSNMEKNSSGAMLASAPPVSPPAEPP